MLPFSSFEHFVLKLFLSGWFVMHFTFPFWDLKLHCTSNHPEQGPMYSVIRLQCEILKLKGSMMFQNWQAYNWAALLHCGLHNFQDCLRPFSSTLLWILYINSRSACVCLSDTTVLHFNSPAEPTCLSDWRAGQPLQAGQGGKGRPGQAKRPGKF